jgi:hypothetical protein
MRFIVRRPCHRAPGGRTGFCVGHSGGGEEKNAEREGLEAAALGSARVAPTGAMQGRENWAILNTPCM